jgi:hypothetical protein
MRFNQGLSLLGLSIALATALPAHAASFTVSSSLSNLSFAVTDLTPTDSSVAAFSLNTTGTDAFIGSLLALETDNPAENVLSLTPSQTTLANAPFDLSKSVSFDQSSRVGQASVTPALVGSASALNATVQVKALNTSMYAESVLAAVNINIVTDKPAAIQNAVVLAPHTSLTITGQAVVNMALADTSLCTGCAMDVEVQAVLLSQAAFGDYFTDGVLMDMNSSIDGVVDSVGINAFYLDGQPTATLLSKTLTLTLRNDTNQAKGFSFIADAWASVRTQTAAPYTPAVPEPQTWGLVLAGLLTCAAIKRRG